MILLDANLLIYSHVASFRQHGPAKAWLDAQLAAGGRVGMPWASLLAFLRIVTNPRVFERPESMADAWRQVQAWLDVDTVWIPDATDRHRVVVGSLLESTVTRANLVPDAHLAAIAIEHGLVLCSTDGDFARFPGLRWENPLRRA
ncbi:MAG TPA: TA system VapC family ribonuclease toxin [Casimicrobiaceae bacterium]|nr:TA system VapC family ribonuclease toxin [Casimicrobiaceae bacterium]